MLTGTLAPMMWIGVIGLGILVPMTVNFMTLNGRKNHLLVAGCWWCSAVCVVRWAVAARFGVVGGQVRHAGAV